ncbi:chemotaxis protein CheA [Eubacteriaceae bacterium ES2]|nr:chemotaxis protein CheA [Eubacteriaceae bacterium ES2]
MMEVYIFETEQILEDLEQLIIDCEKEQSFSAETVGEIFRFMHTIKGSSAMMLFNDIASLSHTVEDVFYFIREEKPQTVDYSKLSDLVLLSVDYIKVELEKIKNGEEVDGNSADLITDLKTLLSQMSGGFEEKLINKPEKDNNNQKFYIAQDKNPQNLRLNCYRAQVFFQDDCMMENIRSYTLVFGLTEMIDEIIYFPSDITENSETALFIRENGFEILLKSEVSILEIENYFKNVITLDRFTLEEISEDDYQKKKILEEAISEVDSKESFLDNSDIEGLTIAKDVNVKAEKGIDKKAKTQSMISVNIDKLDKLMNLVGELVIAESMVTQSPEVKHIESDIFHKASLELHKITGEMQDMVMSVRMVPLSTTFSKMNRIVRDMSKKLNKKIELEMIGEETEVDKNIIEHISDPLMHIIRNAIDHGIEDDEERVLKGKNLVGKITLEAQNIGSDVLIIVRDDGKGLNTEKILSKAMENDLVDKPIEELTERDIYRMVLLPGFSTKENITEFSGRGVGMDVVAKNLEAVGGTVLVDSEPDNGTTITLKIPLTLAIIEGMNIRVGKARYTLPITSISESFRPESKDFVSDSEENEMVMIRGNCYPILRLHEYYNVSGSETSLTKGILIMVEQEGKSICLFADELLGQQQVVVKTLPHYINKLKRSVGVTGCTLLADGSISLIMDIGGITNLRVQ